MRRVCILLVVFMLPGGCSSRLVTNTSRSAIEQMLLTGAVDKAMTKLRLPEVAGKKVYVDFSRLQAVDAGYVQVAVRARLAELGAVLVDKPERAELTAEVASGALGTEYKNAVVGLPALPVPNSPIPLPAAPAYRATERTGIVKLLIFLHAQGKFVAANHYYAKADRGESFLLWWRFQRADEVREGWERADLKLHERDKVGEEAPR